MKLIESSVQIIEERDPYKMIELAGRTCYKSEDKITEDSAKEFVDRMIKLGHGAMLEHGTVYLKIIGVFLDPTDCDVDYGHYVVSHYTKNKYSKVIIKHDEDWKSDVYITTNLRVLVENGWMDDLKYICEPTEHHEKRITAKFICDRGVSHEFVRHRVFSFAQESTRYCNYSKDKFGNELTFIKPSWGYFKNISYEDAGYFDGDVFESSLKKAESYYFKLIEKGWKPQQARQVLPNATKTELVMTGFESDWEHFFELRCSGAAHPDAKKLADELRELMVK
ncbi:thymidylate synthase [uncultured phage cr114_1]|jgi:thymidylate synthase (FAD)|uniref:Thymidylate synthase n=1 Tax=uncultured phage cr114_1 TaxID=2772088 RepID=A0A7M1S155_9CAUD|nr:thymidylate synthase [uncultured phage cr114_1]QOR59952.1 thymidylate synthase [uncultured phage cr114_1]